MNALSLRSLMLLVLAITTVGAAAGCGDDSVESDEEARQAYVGLDLAVDKALNLGMDGFNAATSANIDPQSGTGDSTGTITISGQVDHGASDNKEMRLAVALDNYRDLADDVEPLVTYATHPEALPALDLSLRGIPSGTLTGTLVGTFAMSGDLAGDVSLNLAITADLEPVAGSTTAIQRVVGTTHVTGTATNSAGGVYNVDVTR